MKYFIARLKITLCFNILDGINDLNDRGIVSDHLARAIRRKLLFIIFGDALPVLGYNINSRLILDLEDMV